MRIYIINGLGRIFCFNFNNGAKVLDKNLKYKRKSNKNNLISKQSISNKLEKDYELKVNLEDEFEFKSSYTLKQYSKNYKKIKSKQTSIHELSCNLDTILMKLQKCFDPNLLKDEDLKFAIIKEIIECQRLLIMKSMKQDEADSSISTNEIYDEWKVLASVKD